MKHCMLPIPEACFRVNKACCKLMHVHAITANTCRQFNMHKS